MRISFEPGGCASGRASFHPSHRRNDGRFSAAADGKPPHVVKLAGGPYDRTKALLLIESIYAEIGKKFGTEESKRGMQGVIAN
jgi:hypothetical protein